MKHLILHSQTYKWQIDLLPVHFCRAINPGTNPQTVFTSLALNITSALTVYYILGKASEARLRPPLF